MKFAEEQPADAPFDLVYRMCPLHQLGPGERLKWLKEGQLLEVLTGYDGALQGIPAWCRKCGQQFGHENGI